MIRFLKTIYHKSNTYITLLTVLVCLCSMFVTAFRCGTVDIRTNRFNSTISAALSATYVTCYDGKWNRREPSERKISKSNRHRGWSFHRNKSGSIANVLSIRRTLSHINAYLQHTMGRLLQS